MPKDPYQPPQTEPDRRRTSSPPVRRSFAWRSAFTALAFAALAAAALVGLLLVLASGSGDAVSFGFHPAGAPVPIETPTFSTETAFRAGVGMLGGSIVLSLALAGWILFRSGRRLPDEARDG